jgi:Pregnancy-associated plasma protein-A
MKKSLLLLAAGAFLFSIGCNKSSSDNEESLNKEEEVTATQRKCAADDVLQENLRNDPSLKQRMGAIEEFTRQVEKNPSAYRLVNGIIEIPVIVNVLYKTTAQSISLAQIQSQITVLNNDFAATNSDYNNTPSVFQSARSGNIGIRFVIDNIATDIIRKKTNKSSWQLNDAMKKAAQGGLDPTSPTTKLNIWVCNLTGGYLGYAQFPGGAAATDGVVIDDNAMGTTGTAAAPFNKGRTATHEIGHWMNLYHIWGDDGTACTGSDQVADTPNQANENYGCPSFPQISCSNGANGEMFMNYMDYTDDACMFMFTAGQKTRMQAVFAVGGPRNSFAQ